MISRRSAGLYGPSQGVLDGNSNPISSAKVFSDTRIHSHDGNDSRRIHIADLVGLIETVEVAPTHVARNFFEQIKIMNDGVSIKRLYIYDSVNAEWDYEDLT